MFVRDSTSAALQAFELAEESWEILERNEENTRELADYHYRQLEENIKLIGEARKTRDIPGEIEGEDRHLQALEALENSNHSEVKNFFEEMEPVARNLTLGIEVRNFDDVDRGEKIGEGLNDEVYALEDDRILRVNDTEIHDENEKDRLAIKKKLFDQIPEDINVPSVHSVGTYKGLEASIEDRAPGKPLHERDESYKEWSERLETLADAPQGHYDDLVEDSQRLQEYNLTVDTSAADNIFYDETEGFTFVDINSGPDPDLSRNPDTFTTLLTAINYPSLNNYKEVNEEDIDNLCTIHHKLRKAGDPYSDDFTRKLAKKAYPNSTIPKDQRPPKPEPEITFDIDSDYDNTCDGETSIDEYSSEIEF